MGKFAKRHGGKIVGSDSSDRPGWKGPSYVKKAEPKPKKQKEPKEPEESMDVPPRQTLPVELQQLLLNIFRDAFPDLLASETLKPTLQEVKQALYERDFLRAFGKAEYLEAYSIRWSPSRALCYASILVDIRKHMDGILQDALEDNPFTSLDSALRIVSFGGGAAETVACGGFLRYLHDASASPDETHHTVEATDGITATLDGLAINTRSARKTQLLLVDTAKWGEVVTRLHSSLYALPTMSKYASASAKQANKSLIREGDLATTFQCEDVLSMSLPQLGTIVGNYPMLVTLLFTLNELYTASIAKTTAFLLSLTTVIKPGSLLLVVDSPGSYSETIVGKEAKKYPMHFLLDHTLVETTKGKGTDSKPTWEKIMSEDSHWFRLPKELKYLIDLEDMRYQVHLYRRL